MLNRPRHRGLTRRRLRGTVSALPVSILHLVPAIEQSRRHHVEWLEVLVDEPEYFLKVGQNAAGELIDQECAIGMQHRVRLSENRLPEHRRHRGVRNTGDHVVGMVVSQPGQRRISIYCGSVNDMEPVILEAAAEEAYEVRVGLQRHQHRVGAHSSDNLRGKGADPGPVLEKDAGTVPIDFRQDVIDEET
jgi:hypothetical protein